jgi:AraC-like DNA-binding protein
MSAAHISDITVTRNVLAQGGGWSVADVTFRAPSRRSRIAGRHDEVSICAVTAGSFRYRAAHGSVALMPGAIMLGNAGDEFECSYDEAGGDRCVSFHYAPDYLDRMAGPRAFRTHRVTATPAVVALAARIEAQARCADAGRWEELALRVAGDTMAAAAGETAPQPSARDERRIVAALGFIAANYREALSLAAMAEAVAMSPFHFLRVFRAVAGVTPHQYLMRTRLRRAAIALATTDEPVTAIAFDHGFGDLSSFVTTFGRNFGSAPGAYRRGAQGTPLRQRA